MNIESLFGRSKTPAERLRAHQRSLQKAQRELDRERTKLEAQEKKLVADIKASARKGQMNACKVMAKDLVRTRQYISKFYGMKTQLQAVSLRIQTLRSNQQMAEAMKGATKAMSLMSRQMNLPQIQRILTEFERESSQMDMKEEMMGESIDDVMEDGEGEGEEEQSDKILEELGEAPTTAPPTSVAESTRTAVAEDGGAGHPRRPIPLLRLDQYSDSSSNHFHLPAPPFTSSSTTFILGYIYSGTLDFGNRQFDLTTAFEIRRGGEYLSLSLLQEEVEAKIETMSNLARAARVYVFASAPDVNSQRLARSAEPFVVGRFNETWGCSQIGNLEYEVQRKLVKAVCEAISPESLVGIAKGCFTLRKKLELERAGWAVHVRSMLDAVDDRVKMQLGRNLKEVVISKGFVALVDGQGFSTDVLEWLVADLVVGSLTEGKAAETYQTLVGSVLLREAGIQMDAKVLVEDARNEILEYIKRRTAGIVAAGGFDNLESWCLKELSEELEIPIGDLLTPVSKSGARVTPRPTAKKPILSSSTTTPRTTVVTTSSPAVLPVTPGRVAPRTITPSTTSRSSVVSRTVRERTPSTPTASTAPARAGLAAATRRPTTAATAAPTPKTPTLTTNPAPSPSTSSPKPARAPTAAISTPPAASTSSTASGSTRPSPSTSSRTPTTGAASTSRATTTPSLTRRPPSLAGSERSVGAAPSPSGTIKAKASPRTSSTPRAPLPRTPGVIAPSPGASPSSSGGSVKGKEVQSSFARPTSTTGGREKAKRPASIASTRSVSSVRATPGASTTPPAQGVKKKASSSSVKVVTPKASTRSLAPKSANVSTPTPSTGKEKEKDVASVPPLPSQVSQVPGTTLLSGIPCIVNLAGERPTRFRAAVRYIGGVLWESGQWIGIEVPESAIPDEARDLAWNEGEVGREQRDE
ncbi:SNF7 family protein, charged multivesicular body protein 2A [Pseudohyphozyma bogoriensis]|nr:SNF7 family protein, charged multivesicular body protein 2A [Pseudohyphozyma bogoriensis]